MNVGSLDILITIQSPSYTTGDNGEQTVEWSDFSELWCKFEYKSSTELYENNDQNVSENVITVISRYLEGVTPKMRILDEDGNYYYIVNKPVQTIRGKYMKFDVSYKDNS